MAESAERHIIKNKKLIALRNYFLTSYYAYYRLGAKLRESLGQFFMAHADFMKGTGLQVNPDYYVLLDSKKVEDINCRELIDLLKHLVDDKHRPSPKDGLKNYDFRKIDEWKKTCLRKRRPNQRELPFTPRVVNDFWRRARNCDRDLYEEPTPGHTGVDFMDLVSAFCGYGDFKDFIDGEFGDNFDAGKDPVLLDLSEKFKRYLNSTEGDKERGNRKPNTQSPHLESLNLAGNKKEALNFIIRQINDVDLSHLNGLIIHYYETLDKIESAKNENKPETGQRFQRELDSIEARLQYELTNTLDNEKHKSFLKKGLGGILSLEFMPILEELLMISSKEHSDNKTSESLRMLKQKINREKVQILNDVFEKIELKDATIFEDYFVLATFVDIIIIPSQNGFYRIEEKLKGLFSKLLLAILSKEYALIAGFNHKEDSENIKNQIRSITANLKTAVMNSGLIIDTEYKLPDQTG